MLHQVHDSHFQVSAELHFFLHCDKHDKNNFDYLALNLIALKNLPEVLSCSMGH